MSRRDERGSAVVDFVLVSMLVVPLFLGLIQLGLFLYVRNTLTAAASDGARLAATADRVPADGIVRTEKMIEGTLAPGVVDSIEADSVEIDGQAAVEIVVRARMPVIGLWAPAGLDFTVRGHGIEETP